MTITPPVLEVKDLHAYFGDFHAVRGISVTYDQKSINAIIGPSGCGKSTFIRCLNRIHEEVEGARAEGEINLQGL
jgi:phosphate transport system ATP-binding protein